MFLTIGDEVQIKTITNKKLIEILLNPQLLNSYSYANNNPITLSDPQGTCPICLAAVLLANAPAITSFVQSLTTPLGQAGLHQTTQDIQNGNYGMAVVGALTVGEISKGNIVKGLWSKGPELSAVKNAIKHFENHGDDFGVQNAKQYVEKAREFFNNPPEGTLVGISNTRGGTSKIFYHEASNIRGVISNNGFPQTFFKPSIGSHSYSTNLEYFKKSVRSFIKIERKEK